MSDFETLKAGLKDKWLDYYEANQSWIENLDYWLDFTREPEEEGDDYEGLCASFMLGVISILEPKLRDYLIPLTGIDSEGDQIITQFKLDFDPRVELQKRAEERSKIQEAEIIPLIPDIDPDTEYLNQFRNQN